MHSPYPEREVETFVNKWLSYKAKWNKCEIELYKKCSVAAMKKKWCILIIGRASQSWILIVGLKIETKTDNCLASLFESL